MMDAGAEAAFSATSPPQDDIDLHAEASPLGIAPSSRHVMGTARMGTDPAHLRGVARAAAVGRRQRARLRLVGVRHLRRLQPHAHPRRPRPPGRRRCSATSASDTRVNYAPAHGRPAGAHARRRARAARDELDVTEVPVPPVGADDVLVSVELCGVCGSDLHMVLEGWGAPGSWQGHEWIGTVAAVGDGVTQWKAGDVVVGGPMVRCGTCAMCVAGRPSLCADRDTPGDRSRAGCLRHLQGVARGRAAADARGPRPPRCARWPSRSPSRSTASTRAERQPASGCSCSVPARSAR